MARTNARRARSRRIVVWMVLGFALAQFAAGLAFDYWLPGVRFPYLHRQLRLLDQLPTPPTLVCLGSSRMGTCLHGDLLSDQLQDVGSRNTVAFNAAVPLGDLVAAEHVLDLVLQHGVKPRWVLIEVTPEGLHACNLWVKDHLERHLRWDNLGPFLPEIEATGQMQRLIEQRLFPICFHRRGIWNQLGALMQSWAQGSPPRHHADGARADWNRTLQISPKMTPEEKELKTRQGLEHTREFLRSYRTGGCSMAAFHSILNKCQHNGITPLLVAVPLSSPHRAMHDPNIEQAFRRRVDEACATYGCRFIDARPWLDDDQFLDNHHANAEGAQRFTNRLAQEVLTPLLGQGTVLAQPASRK